MDYEVFILARVREEYDRTGSTDGAVIEGLGRTGRLVTSAALILFLAFASLASAPNTEIKVLATGLGPQGSRTRPAMEGASQLAATTSPAPTVLFDASSIRMKLPVLRFSA